MELSIKGLKTMEGPDSLIFQCSVHADGKRRFVARNDGNGGCHMYDVVKPYAENRAYLDLAEEWAKSLPPRTVEFGGTPFTYDCDLDCVINDLIEDEMERQMLKRHCRTKTVFQPAGSEPGQWMIVDAPFDSPTRQPDEQAAPRGSRPRAPRTGPGKPRQLWGRAGEGDRRGRERGGEGGNSEYRSRM